MFEMRILHVIPDFGYGGAERMASDLLGYLRLSGESVGAVSLYGPLGTDCEDRLRSRRIPVYHLGKRIGLDPRMWVRLEVVVRDFRPDIIHSHRYVLRYLLPSLILHPRAIAVHTLHNVAEREVDALGQWLNRKLFWHRVVPVSIAGAVEDSCLHLYGRKTGICIPNGVGVDLYRTNGGAERLSWRAREGFRSNDVLVACVARLDQQKNHRLLLNAFSRARVPDSTQLVLVGDGPLRSELQNYVRSIGLANRVRFLGVRRDIPAVLAACDVFALSSDWEGHPLVIMEAMATGLPVVCTRVGGTPELIATGQTGLLVAPGDTQALAAALEDVIQAPKLRSKLGSAARQKALNEFDISKMGRAYHELYRALALDNAQK